MRGSFGASSYLWAGGVLAVAIVVGISGFRTRPVPGEPRYVGSRACQDCHADLYEIWASSQHTKMMRRPDAADVVVADFSSDEPGRRFSLEDVAWVIGGKWEQQFMGHADGGETLLPGAWLHLSGEWDFKAWDGWQVPVPRQRCHGCHTVGLEPETGDFVEPNIGCESCHGPSSWHVETLGAGRVTSTTDADVCGQCHVRGTDPSGEYFFPVTYRPGDRLLDHFEPLDAYAGQNSSYWWGNGRERHRHQEFSAWSRGGHANSLDSLRDGYDGRYGPATDACLSCHGAEAILQPSKGVTLAEATEPITCSVCHNTHGRLDRPRMDCTDCHGATGLFHEPDRVTNHVPCPESAGVSCVNCHMPVTGKIGGGFALHSHAPGVISPAEGESWGMPSTCANGGCHVSTPPARLEAHFPQPRPAPPALARHAVDAREGLE